MIRKNKETDPPAARVAALTCRFDQFGRQSFNLSSNYGCFLSGEQLESNFSPCRSQEGCHDTGVSEQGKEDECDEREDHGGFTLPMLKRQALNCLTLEKDRRSFP